MTYLPSTDPTSVGRRSTRPLRIADLFCGAGGTSAGACEAAIECGYVPELTAINHWEIAIATHALNHPGARHLCTGVDSVNPRDLYAPGELSLLWASPECTHHSVARGGKPIHEQSRATAWCVVRWADALLPPVILIENVPEFVTWGPLDSKGRPLQRRKGEIFHAWKCAIEALGYRVDWRVLCAADYGDPTTRRRLFVQCVRGRRKIVWPTPTHAPQQEDSAGLLFGAAPRKRWRAAREIIDWDIAAQSIYERKRPLSNKTMARIMAGLKKFGLKSFVMSAGGPECPARPTDQPMGTILTRDHRAVVEPFIVPNFGEREGQTPRTHSVNEPLPAVTSHGAGALVEPFIIGAGGPEYAAKPQSVNDPMNTVTTENHRALVEPFIVGCEHTGANGSEVRPIDDPLSTITANARKGLAQPFLICMEHQGSVRDVDKPMPTITTAKGGAIGVAEPFLVKLRGTNDAADVNQPSPSVTASGGTLGLAEPFLVHVAHEGGDRGRSVDEPLPTVCGNRGEVGLCEPSLLPQHGGGALRPVSQPCPTITTDGAVGIVEPFLVEYYGTAGAQSVDDPLDTVTTKDRHALVRPVVIIDGQRYLLDIRFRMLQPHELAGAQGFPKDYKFSGNKTQQVKQIGNAVPRNLARALVRAVLEQ